MDQDLSSETQNPTKTTILSRIQLENKGAQGQDPTNPTKRHKILTLRIPIELHFMKNIKIKLKNFSQSFLF